MITEEYQSVKSARKLAMLHQTAASRIKQMGRENVLGVEVQVIL